MLTNFPNKFFDIGESGSRFNADSANYALNVLSELETPQLNMPGRIFASCFCLAEYFDRLTFPETWSNQHKLDQVRKLYTLMNVCLKYFFQATNAEIQPFPELMNARQLHSNLGSLQPGVHIFPIAAEIFDLVELFIPNIDLGSIAESWLGDEKTVDLPCSLLIAKNGHFTRLDVTRENGTKAVLFDDLPSQDHIRGVENHITITNTQLSISPQPKTISNLKSASNLAMLHANSIDICFLPQLENINYQEPARNNLSVAPSQNAASGEISSQTTFDTLHQNSTAIDVIESDITEQKEQLAVTPIKRKQGRPKKADSPKKDEDNFDTSPPNKSTSRRSPRKARSTAPTPTKLTNGLSNHQDDQNPQTCQLSSDMVSNESLPFIERRSYDINIEHIQKLVENFDGKLPVDATTVSTTLCQYFSWMDIIKVRIHKTMVKATKEQYQDVVNMFYAHNNISFYFFEELVTKT